jgi:hypothetical protein
MRIDLYTKMILTVIAVTLLVIAAGSMYRPASVAAQTGLAGVQFVAGGPGIFVFDTRNGDIWQYPYPIDARPPFKVGKITQLGMPYK